MWSILLLAATAAADPVEIFSQWDWPDGESVIGTDGWTSGYDQDLWWGAGDYVLSTSDASGGDFGSGDAIDNYLVNEDVSLRNGYVLASMTTWDDDTMGLLFRHRGGADYYGAILVGSRSGGGGGGGGGGYGSNPFGLDGSTVALLKVQDGELAILDQYEDIAPTVGSDVWVMLGGSGDMVFANFYSTSDDVAADDPAVELIATDPDALGAGSVGFYTYNAGGTSGGWGFEDDGSLTIFEGLKVLEGATFM